MARTREIKEALYEIPAGLPKRALAFIVDVLIIDIIIFFPFRMLFSRLVPELTFSSLNSIMSSPEFAGIFAASAVSMGLLAVLYFSILEYFLKQTPGKMLMKIMVVSSDRQMRPWQALVRSIFLMPVFPFMILWMADIIYAFFNSRRQRLLETISRTRTIESTKVI